MEAPRGHRPTGSAAATIARRTRAVLWSWRVSPTESAVDSNARTSKPVRPSARRLRGLTRWHDTPSPPRCGFSGNPTPLVAGFLHAR